MSIGAKLAAGIFASLGTLLIIIGLILTMSSQPATAEDMLSLGERYLLEMQFEQALVQFLGVIEIEPINVRAYLGAAEAFVGLGQRDSAANILRQGLEQTGDEDIAWAWVMLDPYNYQVYLTIAIFLLSLADDELAAWFDTDFLHNLAIGILREGLARTGSEEIRQKLAELEGTAGPIHAGIGDIIRFGPYDWRVLDLQGGQALIITDRLIDRRPYHHTSEDVTWETSEIRQWLNSEFLDRFNQQELERIAFTLITTGDNQWLGSRSTPGGNNTTDRVFLLSIEEVVRYFGDGGWMGELSLCPNGQMWVWDEYNRARIALDLEGSANWWWLRSPGLFSDRAATVDVSGSLYMWGRGVTWGDHGHGAYVVRPAMWIILDQEFTQAEPEPNIDPSREDNITAVNLLGRWHFVSETVTAPGGEILFELFPDSVFIRYMYRDFFPDGTFVSVFRGHDFTDTHVGTWSAVGTELVKTTHRIETEDIFGLTTEVVDMVEVFTFDLLYEELLVMTTTHFLGTTTHVTRR